jgi:FMN phosphatase YigB (HAD superfamily)
MKIRLVFTELGLTEPISRKSGSSAPHKHTYRDNRRGTPGSVETLVRLRERGRRLAIGTTCQIEVQTTKAGTIGICHLVDRILTSEEAG